MNILTSLFVTILFFILTPGLIVCLPSKGNKYVAAATHAILFSVILFFTINMVEKISLPKIRNPFVKEGLAGAPAPKKK